MNPSRMFFALFTTNLTSVLMRSVNANAVDVRMKIAVLVDVTRFRRMRGGRRVATAAKRMRVTFRLISTGVIDILLKDVKVDDSSWEFSCPCP